MRHTSASLVIQENADPDVRLDLRTALERLAPGDAGWRHDTEGADDMPGPHQDHADRRVAPHSGRRRCSCARHLAGHLCGGTSRPAAPPRRGAAVRRRLRINGPVEVVWGFAAHHSATSKEPQRPGAVERLPYGRDLTEHQIG